MRRFLGLLGLLGFLGLPLTAIAFFESPGALLERIQMNGNPRSFEGVMHARMDDTFFSLWMKGAMEGRTADTFKMKVHATVHVSDGIQNGKATLAFVVHQHALYVKVVSVEGTMAADIGHSAQELAKQPWIKIPLDDYATSNDDPYAATASGLREIGVHMTSEEVRTLIRQLHDALFTMEHARYQGGHAFSLRLSPAFLVNALHVLQRSPLSAALDLPQNDPGSDASLQELQAMILDHVNLHAKVNTNTIGEFLYGKKYVAFENEGFAFVLEVTGQHQPYAVTVEVPEHTIALEEVWHMLGEGISFPAFSPTFRSPDEEMPEWNEPSYSEPRRPAFVPRPVRSVESVSQPASCTAVPGTPAFLHQARKGLCSLPARTNYRINDATSGKVLNPRTTRLKNPHLGW